MAAPTCPHCFTLLKDDYGMVNCPSCGAIVFIDMEGVASVASDTNSASDGPESESEPELDSEPTQVSEPSPIESSPIHFDTADPLGISAYANSEVSSAKDGPLVVTLIISGIDTKEIRDQIRQVLQDPRFAWDAAAMMARGRDGELRVEDISPVKATIVINRIKSLSVKIRWEQSAVTDLEPTNEDSV